MKNQFTVLALAALCASAAQAGVSANYNATEPAGPVQYSFDNLAGSADLSISGGSIQSGSSGQFTQPLGGVGSYYAVAPGVAPGTITFTSGLSSLSFLWGSPDSFNSLDVGMTDASSFSITPFAAGGNNSNSRWLTLTATGGQAIHSLTFNSGNYAFEVDSLRYTAAAVPEPQTYALMLAGLGAIGWLSRRRRPE